jgi:hypothetical protein
LLKQVLQSGTYKMGLPKNISVIKVYVHVFLAPVKNHKTIKNISVYNI